MEKAFQNIEKVVNIVNESTRQSENSTRILSIQNLMEDGEVDFPDLVTDLSGPQTAVYWRNDLKGKLKLSIVGNIFHFTFIQWNGLMINVFGS